MCDRVDTYEAKLAQMLMIARITISACYRPEQVIKLLNVSPAKLRVMCDAWQPDNDGDIDGLESYVLGTQRRIPHHGLVEWLVRNNSFDRQRSA